MPQLFQTSKPVPIVPASVLVDESNDVINSVSVITVGPALGHGLMIDKTTLAQVKACAEQYARGLKVLMDHGSGASEIVGYLSDFRISDDGTKLLGNLYLLKNSPHRDYVLEIAQRIPDTFGLSIAFSGVYEEVNGVRYARCSEIYSCDLVAEPAANPGGLFSRRLDAFNKREGNDPSNKQPVSKTNLKMENELLEQIGKMIDEKCAALAASFDLRLAEITKGKDEEKEAVFKRVEEVAKLSAEAADKAALAAVKEFAKTLGQPATAGTAASAPAPAPVVKKFEELVRAHPDYAKSKTNAIRAVMSANADAYREYKQRLEENGEVILF